MSVTSTATGIYAFEGFHLNAAKRRLFDSDGKNLPLMPKGFDILLYLVSHSGRAVDKDELMTAVWPDTIVEENNLTQNISAIRRILGEKHGENRFIATLPGRGYKFVADVKEVSGLTAEAVDSDPANIFSEKREPSRFWILSLGALVLIGLASVGILRWSANMSPADGQLRSMAVLPFKPITAENRDEALEIGMADTLISKLDDGEQLKVRPLVAVRRFSSVEQDAIEAGRQLGVEAVLDGGVQIAGGRVRISAKLFRVSDGRQIWAGQFDEPLNDIFAVQDSISEKVASALRIRLGNQSHKSYTENVEAYQLFMRGKFHAYRLILPEVQQGISCYQQAIAADPSFALAYVELANAYRAMVLTNDAPANEMMPKSRAAAEKAIELDTSLAEAWMALAFSNFWYDWNYRLSEQHFKKALELDPNSAQSHAYYAHLLSNTGRNDDAIVEIRHARRIDPIDLLTSAIEGQILFFADRDEESMKTLQSIILEDPNFWLAHLFISRNYIKKGLWTEAITSLTKARDITGGNSEATATLAFALAKSGQRREARKIVDDLYARAKSRYVPSYALALSRLAIGERAQALELLEKAFDQREPMMVFLMVDPKWDNLRSDPRFIDIMKRMNFEE